jgi:hypothetical protein
MRLRYLATAAVLAAAPLFGASAEPQILGLLARAEAVPLVCSGGECFAEVSSFCMEPDRSSPAHATAYSPLAGADLTLVATAADGSETRVPAAGLAAFENRRGYASVRVSVPETALAELGATAVALKVGQRVSLLPRPSEKFRRAHEPEEIAITTGPHRIVGERIVDRGGASADAARLIDRLLNRLPDWGHVSDQVRKGLWRETIETAALETSSGASIAHGAFELCRDKDPEVTRFTFRQCLEGRHDKLIWSLNRVYWASVGGS